MPSLSKGHAAVSKDRYALQAIDKSRLSLDITLNLASQNLARLETRRQLIAFRFEDPRLSVIKQQLKKN